MNASSRISTTRSDDAVSIILSVLLLALVIVNAALLYTNQRARRKRLENETKFLQHIRRRYQEDYDD